MQMHIIPVRLSNSNLSLIDGAVFGECDTLDANFHFSLEQFLILGGEKQQSFHVYIKPSRQMLTCFDFIE